MIESPCHTRLIACLLAFDSHNSSTLPCFPALADLPSRPSWTGVPVPRSLTGEARVLAEGYRCGHFVLCHIYLFDSLQQLVNVTALDERFMVWKVILDYKKKCKQETKPLHQNEHVRAALGQIKPLEPMERKFYIPTVKFPTKEDEWESVRLFRRCGGPLAATLPGHRQLIKESKLFYGDGRSVQLCRVAGCQKPFSKSGEFRTEHVHLCQGIFS